MTAIRQCDNRNVHHDHPWTTPEFDLGKPGLDPFTRYYFCHGISEIVEIGPSTMSPARNGPASQEFRNGAATGIADLVARLVAMSSWGLPIDERNVRQVADALTAEWGGVDVNEAGR